MKTVISEKYNKVRDSIIAQSEYDVRDTLAKFVKDDYIYDFAMTTWEDGRIDTAVKFNEGEQFWLITGTHLCKESLA